LRGKLAELLMKVAPEFYTKDMVTGAKGNTGLYVLLASALFGFMKAAILSTNGFSKVSNPSISN
jgi:hypothetical protein